MSWGSETAVAVIAAAVLSGTAALLAARSAPALNAGAEDRIAPRTHMVEIREFGFEPVDLVVSVGDTVRWINRDPVPHTATARDSTWNSGRIAPGGQWQVVVRADATSGYFCIYHPSMAATIRIIEAAGMGAQPPWSLVPPFLLPDARYKIANPG